MKKILTFLFVLSSTLILAQAKKENSKIQIVEASCGQCQFKMPGKGCTLAVRINGKAYFVDKAHIDGFGDAHAKMGFCNAIRKAKVQGSVVGNKFVPTYFKLLEKNNNEK
jgi:hypothetical protein